MANESGSSFYNKPVHERLHKAAVAKQKMEKNSRSFSHRGANSNTSFDQEQRNGTDNISLSNRAQKRGLKSAARKPPVPMMQSSAQTLPIA